MSCSTTSEHPRLIASIPTDPEPLYKSNHRPGLSEAGEPPADCKLWSRVNECLGINQKGNKWLESHQQNQ